MIAQPPDEAALARRIAEVLEDCPAENAMAILAGVLAARIHASHPEHVGRIRAFTAVQDAIITVLKEHQS